MDPAAAPKPPEKYELKLPDGSLLSPKDVEKVSAFAREKGMSQEQAQTLIEQRHEAVSDFMAQATANHQAEMKGWKEKIASDPEMGGANAEKNVQLAHEFFKAHADPETIREAEASGMGNHPGFVKLIWRLAMKAQPDKPIPPGNPQTVAPKSAAEMFWPKKEGAA